MRSLFRYVLYAGLLVGGVIVLWMMFFIERIFQGGKADDKTPNFIDTVDAAPPVNNDVSTLFRTKNHAAF